MALMIFVIESGSNDIVMILRPIFNYDNWPSDVCCDPERIERSSRVMKIGPKLIGRRDAGRCYRNRDCPGRIGTRRTGDLKFLNK